MSFEAEFKQIYDAALRRGTSLVQVEPITAQPWFRRATDGPGIVAGVRDIFTQNGGAHFTTCALARDSNYQNVDTTCENALPPDGIMYVCTMGAVFLVTGIKICRQYLSDAPAYVHQAINMIAREVVRMSDDTFFLTGASPVERIMRANDAYNRQYIVDACTAALDAYARGDVLEGHDCTSNDTYPVVYGPRAASYVVFDYMQIKEEKAVVRVYSLSMTTCKAVAKKFTAADGYGDVTPLTMKNTTAPTAYEPWWMNAPQLKEAA